VPEERQAQVPENDPKVKFHEVKRPLKEIMQLGIMGRSDD
jgi:hypothetical protein